MGVVVVSIAVLDKYSFWLSLEETPYDTWHLVPFGLE
jgi:hypothetical protein